MNESVEGCALNNNDGQGDGIKDCRGVLCKSSAAGYRKTCTKMIRSVTGRTAKGMDVDPNCELVHCVKSRRTVVINADEGAN